MTEGTETDGEKMDQGEVVRHPRTRLSLAWLFPVLAAAAAAWLFWSQWKSNGPEIEIRFDDAPGLQAGKTQLIYRGVDSGTVTGVKLDSTLNTVIVRVRLKAFAADLAQEGTVFWIDQPVIGIGDTSGLDAIIQGNSIQARMGAGGAPTTQFTGLAKQPLTPLETPALIIRLHAPSIPFLARGAPVYYRGMPVGVVEDKILGNDGFPFLQVVIDKEFAQTVRSNSRFWYIAATSVHAGPGGVKLDVAGLNALLRGGVAFDAFGAPGDAVKDGASFDLSASEHVARASAPPIHVAFNNGRGLVAGETQVCYLGQPIGFVETVRPDPANGKIETSVRLEPEYESLKNAGTTFTLVRPRISMNGVSGLDTIVTGVYINCVPGAAGARAEHFTGRSITDEEWNRAQEENEGVRVTLRAKDIPNIGKGAPVIYRGITVGTVKEKTLDENRLPVLRAVIRKEFASTVRRNARFWRLPATSVQAGPGVLKVDVAGLETLWQGGVAFDVFEMPADAVETDADFELFADERAARSSSPPLKIVFENGQGLLAGETQLRYLGVPVGLVESVQALNGKVTVIARLEPGYENLRRANSSFALVRPQISMKGVSGLETLVSGVFIDCIPGSSAALSGSFIGHSSVAAATEQDHRDLEIVVTAASTSIGVDAPVYYRGLRVGRVIRKTLASDGRKIGLVASIDASYATLVRENTKFWDVNGVQASLGFFVIKVQTPPIDSLLHGGIAFATPDNSTMGAPVKRGHEFDLNPAPRREWLRWMPTIPLGPE